MRRAAEERLSAAYKDVHARRGRFDVRLECTDRHSRAFCTRTARAGGQKVTLALFEQVVVPASQTR